MESELEEIIREISLENERIAKNTDRKRPGDEDGEMPKIE
jgi:hypothetical protein